jgi:FkbM family methyltransferase
LILRPIVAIPSGFCPARDKGAEYLNPVFKNMLRNALRRFDLDLVHASRQRQLESESQAGRLLPLVLELQSSVHADWPNILRHSKSQLGQDLFVWAELNFKRNGYFVEFGATNGVELSNTYMLEKEFGWTGILAEPGRRWHKHLKRNRGCHIETDCVWATSNATLTFNEADLGEFSTVDSFSSADSYEQIRKKGRKYAVNTISLTDLLDKYKAPGVIDYLSIDTEGSEFEILEDFNFDKYQFRVITCEHNFTAQREKIFSLLSRNGYVRKFEAFSDIDDWYIRPGTT